MLSFGCEHSYPPLFVSDMTVHKLMSLLQTPATKKLQPGHLKYEFKQTNKQTNMELIKLWFFVCSFASFFTVIQNWKNLRNGLLSSTKAKLALGCRVAS